jgi:hypothetical protein
MWQAELQELWADKDNCDHLELCDAACNRVRAQMGGTQTCATTFGGAQRCFDCRKASLLHQTSLPTIDEAIVAKTQKEVWLSLDR